MKSILYKNTKKIYDECELKDKIKILGNIQKYQVDMLNFHP